MNKADSMFLWSSDQVKLTYTPTQGLCTSPVQHFFGHQTRLNLLSKTQLLDYELQIGLQEQVAE